MRGEIVKEIVRETPVEEKVTKVSKKRKGGISKANGERKKLHEDPYAAKLHQLEQIQLFSKRIIDKEALRLPQDSSPYSRQKLDQPTLKGFKTQ